MHLMARLSLGGAVSAALAAMALVVFAAGGPSTIAADHVDPPTRTDPAVDPVPDLAADNADVYGWATDTSVVLVITFAGPQATSLPATYDRDVLYVLNVSNAPPRTTADFPIEIRFGRDASMPGDNFGVRVANLPGVNGPIIGPVETDLVRDGVTVRAGLFDDPFFFDSQGLRETRNTGTLSFRSDRDFFSRQNITGVVIEIPKSRLANGSNPIDVWTTTARFGGQL